MLSKDMHKCPDDEVPASTVPHTRQKPDYKEVERLMAAVATKRNVDIVTEETTQRDVPPTPEVGNRPTAIGMIKVLIEVEAHTAAHTNGHIGVARKVEVNLQRIGQYTNPRTRRREAVYAAEKELVGQLRELVGDDDLLAQANKEAKDSIGNILRRSLTLVDLTRDGIVAHDRACHELREHRNIEQQITKMALHGGLTTVDIDKVGYRLEGVEANTYRERYLWHGDIDTQRVERGGDESCILKYAENQDIDNQAHNKGTLASTTLKAVYGQATKIVEQHAQYHQEDVDRLTPAVEDEREEHNDDIA